MNRCPESERIQIWLDGELPSASARAIVRHHDGCRRCQAEVAALEALFAMLARAPIVDPGPRLTERILDRTVPSRVRRHVVTAVGWVYTAVSAVTTFAFISWIVRPETHVWLGRLLTTTSARVIDTALFSLDTLMAMAVQLQRGMSLLEALGGWLVPVARALAAVAAEPWIAAALWGAVVTSAALLWWIRPRPVRIVKGNRHVGLLAL